MNEENQALQELSHNWRRKSSERLLAAQRDLAEDMLEIAVSNDRSRRSPGLNAGSAVPHIA